MSGARPRVSAGWPLSWLLFTFVDQVSVAPHFHARTSLVLGELEQRVGPQNGRGVVAVGSLGEGDDPVFAIQAIASVTRHAPETGVGRVRFCDDFGAAARYSGRRLLRSNSARVTFLFCAHAVSQLQKSSARWARKAADVNRKKAPS